MFHHGQTHLSSSVLTARHDTDESITVRRQPPCFLQQNPTPASFGKEEICSVERAMKCLIGSRTFRSGGADLFDGVPRRDALKSGPFHFSRPSRCEWAGRAQEPFPKLDSLIQCVLKHVPVRLPVHSHRGSRFRSFDSADRFQNVAESHGLPDTGAVEPLMHRRPVRSWPAVLVVLSAQDCKARETQVVAMVPGQRLPRCTHSFTRRRSTSCSMRISTPLPAQNFAQAAFLALVPCSGAARLRRVSLPHRRHTRPGCPRKRRSYAKFCRSLCGQSRYRLRHLVSRTTASQAFFGNTGAARSGCGRHILSLSSFFPPTSQQVAKLGCSPSAAPLEGSSARPVFCAWMKCGRDRDRRPPTSGQCLAPPATGEGKNEDPTQGTGGRARRCFSNASASAVLPRFTLAFQSSDSPRWRFPGMQQLLSANATALIFLLPF